MARYLGIQLITKRVGSLKQHKRFTLYKHSDVNCRSGLRENWKLRSLPADVVDLCKLTCFLLVWMANVNNHVYCR